MWTTQTNSIPKDLSKALTWTDKSTAAPLIIPKFWKNIQVFNDRWEDEEDVFVPVICESKPSAYGDFVTTHFSVKRDETQSSKIALTLLNSNSYSVNKVQGIPLPESMLQAVGKKSKESRRRKAKLSLLLNKIVNPVRKTWHMYAQWKNTQL